MALPPHGHLAADRRQGKAKKEVYQTRFDILKRQILNKMREKIGQWSFPPHVRRVLVRLLAVTLSALLVAFVVPLAVENRNIELAGMDYLQSLSNVNDARSSISLTLTML